MKCQTVLESGQCLGVYPCQRLSVRWSSKAPGLSFAGTQTGEVLFLESNSVPCSGPTILTAANPQQARCPVRGQEFATTPALVAAIQERRPKGELSCIDLPAAAFANPRLLSACPHCQNPLQFNLFFSASDADDYAEVLRRGLEYSRREKGANHEETLAHLAVLTEHYEQVGQSKIARLGTRSKAE